MKNSSYTSTKTASKPMNDLADTMNSSSRISTTSLRIEDLNCQPFFMRGYVAQMRDTTPRACIPFDGISEDTWNQQRGSLDVPRHRWWRRCKTCVHEAAPSSVAIDERLNELSDTIKSLSIDSTTSDELKNENLNCQPFSMRKYVAEKRNMNPKVCIPFDGITENTWEQLRGTLDVPRFRWWRCRSCVREPVTCSTTAQDSSLKLTVHGGSLKKNETEPLAKAINMVDSIGEREIPNTISLEVLARLAVEMASGHPQLLETSQTSNAEKHISLERKTAGFGTDAIVGDGDKALIFTDVIDSEDERENKKTRLLKELIRVEVEAKAIAGKGATTHTLQRTEERPSSSKGKNINSEVHYNGQEFVRPEGSRKAKRICPFLPETNPTSRYFSETPVSQKRRKSNGGK